MRHRQRLFLSINRIFLLLYAPLSIALAIYYLFTGSLIRSILALYTLFWIFLPYIVHYFVHLRPGHLLLSFYCILILFGYSGGLVLSFGKYFFWYDQLIHVYSGFFFCLLAAAVFCFFTKKRVNQMNQKFCYVFCISFSFTAFLMFEVLQLIMDTVIMKVQFMLSNLIADFIAWAIGIAILIACMAINHRKKIHAYPLYAFEDFACLNVKSTIEILK